MACAGVTEEMHAAATIAAANAPLIVGMAIILSVTLLKQELREMAFIVLGVFLLVAAGGTRRVFVSMPQSLPLQKVKLEPQ